MRIRDNWNESIQTLLIEEDLTNEREFESKELYTIIEKFRDEYQRLFYGDRVSPHATQSLQHVMKLVLQRLNTLMLTMDIQFSKIKADSYNITWTDDGKGLAANIKEEINTTRIYRSKGKEISKFKNKEIAEYVVVETDITADKIQCLNCGGTIDKFEDSYTCTFCKSVFLQQEYFKHITAFRVRKDYDIAIKRIRRFGRWTMRNIPILAYIVTYIGGYIFAYYTGSKPSKLHSDARLLSLIFGSLISIISIFIGLIYTSTRTIYRKTINAKDVYTKLALNIPFENRVKEFDPNFSLENFEGMLQNRLIMLYFAERQEEISSFIKCNCNEFINTHNNVVDSVLVSVRYHDYRVDEHYQHICLTASLLIYKYDKDKIRESREIIGMSLYKSCLAKNQNVDDAVLFTCASCGNNLDLMKGGRCDACHNELNLSDHDWVISELTPGVAMTGMVKGISNNSHDKNSGILHILSRMFDIKGVNIPAIIFAIITIILLFFPIKLHRSLMNTGDGWLFIIVIAIYISFVYLNMKKMAFVTSLFLVLQSIFAISLYKVSLNSILILLCTIGTGVSIPIHSIIMRKRSGMK
ncbi:MAG: hypothetical protein GX319_08595 [Clostridiales bacterium]|jgi:hypothetical protein|nr:hypothetical protein [Clostridiales bacterium]